MLMADPYLSHNFANTAPMRRSRNAWHDVPVRTDGLQEDYVLEPLPLRPAPGAGAVMLSDEDMRLFRTLSPGKHKGKRSLPDEDGDDEEGNSKATGAASPPRKRPRRRSRKQPRPVVVVMPQGIGPVGVLNCNDVLCGRGGAVNSHSGNIQYRELVKTRRAEYMHPDTAKLEKAFIAASIVKHVRAMQPPGRFLYEDVEDGFWYDVGDARAFKKTGQALRENAHDIPHPLPPSMAQKQDLKMQLAPAAVPNGGNDIAEHSNQMHYQEQADRLSVPFGLFVANSVSTPTTAAAYVPGPLPTHSFVDYSRLQMSLGDASPRPCASSSSAWNQQSAATPFVLSSAQQSASLLGPQSSSLYGWPSSAASAMPTPSSAVGPFGFAFASANRIDYDNDTEAIPTPAFPNSRAARQE